MKTKNSNSNPVLTKKEQGLLCGSLLVILVTLFSFSGKKTEDKAEETQVKQTQMSTKQISPENKLNVNENKVLKTRNPSNTTSNTKTSKKVLSKNPFQSHLECIKTQNCDLPNDDPRAYMLSAYKNLSEAIKKNNDYFLKGWNENKKAQLQSFLKLPDGYVKQEALRVALQLPKSDSEKLLNSVTEDVLHYHDSELIKDTLTFLNKNMNSGNEQFIYNEVSKALTNGSPFVSEALAENIDVLLNTRSLKSFKTVASELPKGSAEKVFLSSSIKEFEMRQSGG